MCFKRQHQRNCDPASHKNIPKMSQTNKSSIPAWQKRTSIPGAEEPSHSKVAPSETTAAVAEEKSNESEDVQERARKFLEDPTIKNASREKKLAFLESKGLKKEDVEGLLDASTSTSPSESHQHTSNAASTPTPTTSSDSSRQTPSRDVPPVITYPEFLIHSNKPPPLVTKSFLLNTAYLASGVAASMWGLSKYVVEPMQVTLSESRHNFFAHASSKVENLNSKLSGIVSTVPSSRPTTSHKDDRADATSEKSDDSDPTELFHHDIGTQTSPTLLSRRNSIASSSTNPSSTGTPAQQEDRLRNLSLHLKDLQSSTRHGTESEDEINTQLSELHSYLGDMRYTNPYIKNSAYGASWPGLGAMSGGGSTGDGNDEIDKFMKDIKAVKGVLLSTRNFPRAGGSASTYGVLG